MGQKVQPFGFRLASEKNWRSVWYTDSKEEFRRFLYEDHLIRQFLKKRFEGAAISDIIIERARKKVRITLYSARPGIIYGRKSSELEKVQQQLHEKFPDREILIDIKEIKNPEVDAQLVAENIALQLEKRISFRRAMKKAVQTAMDFGAQGIKVRCSGRLGGTDIARAEQYREGTVPLHTLRSKIKYGTCEANTMAGKIGIKVWICQKEEAPVGAA